MEPRTPVQSHPPPHGVTLPPRGRYTMLTTPITNSSRLRRQMDSKLSNDPPINASCHGILYKRYHPTFREITEVFLLAVPLRFRVSVNWVLMAFFHGLVTRRLSSAFLSFVLISSFLHHGELDLMGEAAQLPSSDLTSQSRKLLGIDLNVTTTGRGFVEGVADVGRMMEMAGEEVCSKDVIVVHQAATPPLPSGIPTYTVEVLNTCPSGCAVANIHLSCGWYSSARLVDPRIFRRLSYNDCLVNDGASLPAGDSVSFQYANSFHYPLAVSSVTC
ncbi:hypothetical protein GW17_00053138 [Ensete ventricosum]|nr:hypothetical protein GW17_00053138 [Ensete ventricosum]